MGIHFDSKKDNQKLIYHFFYQGPCFTFFRYLGCIFIRNISPENRCFNAIIWLMRRHDARQRQVNVETTLRRSKFKFTTLNNVESLLSISKLIWTMLDNVNKTLWYMTACVKNLKKWVFRQKHKNFLSFK